MVRTVHSQLWVTLVHSFKQAVTWGFSYHAKDCRSLANSPGTRKKHDLMAPVASLGQWAPSSCLFPWTPSGLKGGVGSAWASTHIGVSWGLTQVLSRAGRRKASMHQNGSLPSVLTLSAHAVNPPSCK